MIKLGEGYYDEASIIAITPSRDPRTSDSPVDQYIIYTAGSHSFRWDANAAEIQRRLAEVGLIAPRPMPMLELTVSELAELGACLADGYSYAAKDEDGRIYAFSEVPLKRR